jgi:rubrerythrin
MARLIDADKVEELLIFLKEQCEKEQNPLTGAMWGSFQAVLEFVREQPTIEPVKRGEWIRFVETIKTPRMLCGIDRVTYWYKCSICGLLTKATSCYCPDCGSKMDGEE